MNCPACKRIELIRAGADPHFIAELRECFAVVHKHQRYRGWCTLWLKDHHEQLGLLPRERQRRLAEDVADAAAAMHAALRPDRINYECLGNVVAHVHWHLIPRRSTDPEPGATVWVRPSAETECGANAADIAELVRILRAAGLGGTGSQGQIRICNKVASRLDPEESSGDSSAGPRWACSPPELRAELRR